MATMIDKARDGDGDGKVNDGTPRERPVGPGDTIGRGRKKVPGRRSGRIGAANRSGAPRKSGEKVDAKGEKVGTAENPIKVKSASRALELMGAGEHVEMDHATLAVVMKKLAKIGSEAYEKGEQAPDYDLCRVHVPDTNIFCEGNKGYGRKAMPQLVGKNLEPDSIAAKKLADGKGNEFGEVDFTDEFVVSLEEQGISITEDVREARTLRATQAELVGSQVGSMMVAAHKGKFDPRKEKIFISRDGYILDGHHRWATVVAMEYVDKDDLTMDVRVIDMTIQDLLDETLKFTKKVGLKGQDKTALKSVKKELPCIGCGDEPVLSDDFRHRDLVAKKDGRNYSIPNPKSSPKEIVGSHGHKPHGTSILWPALYEELRKKGYSKSKAAAISNGQWNKKHGKGAKNLASTRVTKATEISGEISKVDADKQLVYGWMYVTHDRDGEVVIDKSGDFIDDIEELDSAVVDFVLHQRVGGVDHERDGGGPRQASRLVESIVFTPEKLQAMGLEPGALPTGWWGGWKVDDPEVWAGVKSGLYKSFSIHGSGVREPVHAEIGKADLKESRRKAAAYTGKQVRGARSGTLSSKERKQRIDAARASAAKRKGSGSKDKNPKTPETVARERTRIRRETPGTPEYNDAFKRMATAITSGKPMKVREGELDSVIERAKARGLKYEHEGDTVTIHLSDGRKLMVQTTKKKSEED